MESEQPVSTSRATIEALQAHCQELATSEFRGQTRVVVPAAQLRAIFRCLRDERGFDLLIDVTCVDYLTYRGATDRFGLVYVVSATATNESLVVRVMVNEPAPLVPSATEFWEAANWLEREVWDMFGVRFDGHSDLRRILLPEEFIAHPLRKDYPLQGHGERHNFPVLTRGEA